MTHVTPVLRAEKLAKTYRLGFFRKRVEAIRDVSLEVAPGQIFGLLGPNGAGKTTTLKVLMGLVRASSGKAEVFGMPAGDVRARRRLGYLPETPYFYDYLTGREFLMLVGQLSDLSRKEAAKRADGLLERVGIAEAATRALRRYSKGMLQRIGLAQTLIHDPELVILDEPLTGLDPIGRKQLRELIAELRAEGKTVVFSSHVLSDVEQLADRVAIVVRGRTVSSGKLSELVDPRILSTEILVAEASKELRATLADRAGLAVQHVDPFLQVVVSHQQSDGAGPPAIDALVEEIHAAGAKLHAITPRKESLEDVVVRQVLREREAS
jgi:ABC-2 type transport system ATP-binding protein